MELNETLLKIKTMLKERGWSIYKLAKESGIPYSSLNSLFQKNNQPTISTLEKICCGFHISMEEFFSGDTPYSEIRYDFSNEELCIIEMYRSLTSRDRKLFLAYIKGFSKTPY